MNTSAISRPRVLTDPIFLNFRSEVVQPVRFAIVFWDGAGDTLYAFEEAEAFERQCKTAERHFVHVHRLTAVEAAAWIAGGGNAVLHEVSAAGVAAFGNLKLATG